jgi:hypothetical protein
MIFFFFFFFCFFAYLLQGLRHRLLELHGLRHGLLSHGRGGVYVRGRADEEAK